MKNLLSFLAFVLGVSTLAMTFLAIWGTEPWRWGLTAVITGIAAGVCWTLGDEAPAPVSRPRDIDRSHHLY